MFKLMGKKIIAILTLIAYIAIISQWLNSVIYWLINHCMTGVMSFGNQFDFHDVIYHIEPCNIDNTQCNANFTISFPHNSRGATFTHVNCTVSCFCNKRLRNWPTFYTNFTM